MNKLTWKKLMVKIFLDNASKGKFAVHLSEIYECVLEAEKTEDLNFNVNKGYVGGGGKLIKFQRDVRNILNRNQYQENKVDWLFKKNNIAHDGIWSLNPKILYENNIETSNKISAKGEKKPIMKFTNQLVRDSYSQYKFAEEIKNTLGRRCLFCGSQISEIIEAAHINDEKNENFFDSNNGLPLCRNCHKLFDTHKITVDSNLKIYIDNELNYMDLNEELDLSFIKNTNSVEKIKINLMLRNNKIPGNNQTKK